MTIDNAAEIVNSGIQAIIIISLPSVGLGIVVGLIIAIFQAVTQIQEQTLTFVPKMIVVFLVIAMTFTWMGSLMVELTETLFAQIPIYSR